MATIRVAPNEANPTHHIQLNDRKGVTLGLTITDSQGNPKPLREPGLYTVNPVTTTAFKQTSGQGGYDIFEYPYNPIVQDDGSGGRGNLDFERDSTKFYDSFRAATWRANKAYAGPQEQYVSGAHRSLIQSMPGSVGWIQMTGVNRYLYKRFQATGMTTAKVWMLLRRKGKPGDLTIGLYEDNAGARGSLLDDVTIPYTETADVLMEWLNQSLAQTLTNGSYYWLVAYADAGDTDGKHWLMGVNEEVGSSSTSETLVTSPTAAVFDLYYRFSDTDSEKTCLGFEYKEQQYFLVSGSSGAPSLYQMGDRGAADSNTGQLTKLIDATKSWTTDEWVGKIVLITDGPGKLEAQPWRTITANNGTTLTLDSAWTIDHTTTTEYVILGDKPRLISGHGLTAPVTDVVVSPQGVVYVCMGDSTTVRRLRAFNNAGVWADFSDAVNCQAAEGTLTAVFMVYKPQAGTFVVANNDLAGAVSVNTSTNASVPAWGVALTWGTAKTVDSKYRRVQGLIVHPDPGGNEAVWIFKTDMPYVLSSSGNPYPVGPEEFRSVRSLYNGVRPIRQDVYLYFPLLQGLERYYGGTYTDMGPNLGEGLPTERRGNIVSMVAYPGKFFVAVDGGSAGYSSVLVSGGWHEMYRAPKGQRIKHMAFQVIPGTDLDRLWIYQGNDFIWLPFPSSTTNELDDENYLHTPEFAIELSRMHAGMYDVQKMVKLLKIQSDRLEVAPNDNRPICYIELDYKKDDDEEWTTLDQPFTISPTQTVDFTPVYGLAGKRLRFRLRVYTRDASKTAVFLAIMIFTVMRVDVKSFYGLFNILCEDDESVGMREGDKSISGLDKLQKIRDWGDASNDSMLRMRSVSPLLDDKMVFLNVGSFSQIRFKSESGNEHSREAYLVQVTLQDA